MRLSTLFAVALSMVLCAGCLDQLVPDHQGAAQGNHQSADAATPAADGAMNTPTDAAVQSDAAPARAGDGGLAGFGATCTTNADCQSNICQPSNMGASMACTQTCQNPGQNDPTCPGGGLCNAKGYCKT